MSVKKSLKATVKASTRDPVGGTKELIAVGKRDLKHKTPTPDTSAQDAVIEQQAITQADLDSEENRRRKRLLSAATGIRAFRGSPLFRATPSDSTGRAAGAAATVSGAGSGYASAAYIGGGARSGRGGGGGRTLIN